MPTEHRTTKCRYCAGTGSADYAALALDVCERCGGTGTSHTDDIAVDRFAEMMKAKLAVARSKGRSGWETCQEEELLEMLDHHVIKGDMRDVANIAMMIHLNREARRAAWAEEVPLV